MDSAPEQELLVRTLQAIQGEYAVDGLELKPSLARQANRTLIPTMTELRSMVRDLSERHGWSPSLIAAMLGFSTYDTNRLLSNSQQRIATQAARSLWLLWMHEVSPALLNDPLQIASWGRLDMPSLALRPWGLVRPLERRRIIEEIEANGWQRPRPVNYYVGRFALHPEAVALACFEAGIPLRQPPKRRIHKFLRPGSIWREVDWRLPNRTIARQEKAYYRDVSRARKVLSKLARDGELSWQLSAVGANPSYFSYFYEKCEKYEKQVDSAPAPGAESPCENNLSGVP